MTPNATGTPRPDDASPGWPSPERRAELEQLAYTTLVQSLQTLDLSEAEHPDILRSIVAMKATLLLMAANVGWMVASASEDPEERAKLIRDMIEPLPALCHRAVAMVASVVPEPPEEHHAPEPIGSRTGPADHRVPPESPDLQGHQDADGADRRSGG